MRFNGEFAWPQRIGIISDDLTGSNSAASRLAEILNMNCRTIWLDSNCVSNKIADGVTAINTGTRTTDELFAVNQVKRAVKRLQTSNISWVFKRFDSHLRGHLGAETKTFLESCNFRTVFVCAAYPGTGKSTVAGVQMNRGIPVNETEMRNDPINAVRESHLPTIFKNQNLNVELITMEWEKQSNELLIHNLIEAAKSADIVVCDAKTDAHLFRLSYALANKEIENSIGRFGIACTDLQLPGYFLLNYLVNRSYKRKPIVTVVGSITEIVQKQVSWACKYTDVDILEFNLDEGTSDDFLDQAFKCLNKSKDLIIHTGKRRNIPPEEAKNFAVQLGKAVKLIMHKVDIKALMIVGGETANEVCKSLECIAIQDIKQFESGITYAYFYTKQGLNKPFILRSGAVGEETTLAKYMLRLIT